MIKKIVISLIGIIVVLVVAFVCVGVFVPSVEYTTTVEINKPRDVVWRVLRERKDWIYGFQSFEQISGSPNEVGSRSRVTVFRDGREYSFDSELKQVKPPEMAETELTNNMLVHDAVVNLTENSGKTTLVSNEKITGTNLIYRSLFALFKSQIAGVSAKNFDGLKQAVESEN
jgi:hypothetical protein